MKQPFTFRELRTPDEILQSLKLRYDVYSQCHMKTFLHPNPLEIDADCFDEHSRHYGLYQDQTLAGYIRVIMPKAEYQNPEFNSLKKEHIEMRQTDFPDYLSDAPYPYLSYSGLPVSYWQHYHRLQSCKYDVVEGGRLVLKPEFRDLRTSKFLIESVFTLYFLLHPVPGNAVVTCCKDHYRFYSYYGFQPIGEGDSYYTNGNTLISVTIPISTLSGVPTHLHDRFTKMADEYSSTGKIEFQP